MERKRIFARLMARELSAEELALAAGGMAAGPGGPKPTGSCSWTISQGAGGRYVSDDSVPD